MSRIGADTDVPIECPQCRRKTEKTLAWLEAHQEFVCPGCGTRFAVDRDQIRREAVKLDGALAKLFDQIGAFTKKR